MKEIRYFIALQILAAIYFLVKALSLKGEMTIYWEIFPLFLSSTITTYGLYEIKQMT